MSGSHEKNAEGNLRLYDNCRRETRKMRRGGPAGRPPILNIIILFDSERLAYHASKDIGKIIGLPDGRPYRPARRKRREGFP